MWVGTWYIVMWVGHIATKQLTTEQIKCKLNCVITGMATGGTEHARSRQVEISLVTVGKSLGRERKAVF